MYLTYEGLKQSSAGIGTMRSTGLYLTYEGLKHASFGIWTCNKKRLYLTYEGLKLIYLVMDQAGKFTFVSYL